MSGSAAAEPDDFLDKMYALALVALRGRDLFARLWPFPLRRANRRNPHLRPHIYFVQIVDRSARFKACPL
jgi:hypothetical protein